MKIKELRKKHNLTQTEIANILNIKYETYKSYENKKRMPNIETLIKLADYFNVSLDYLLDRNYNCITSLEYKLIGYFRELNEFAQGRVLGYAKAESENENNKLTKNISAN